LAVLEYRTALASRHLCDAVAVTDALLEVVYRDESLVAINKPSGLLVHRSPVDRHETRFALQLLRDQLGQRVYPTHRLDTPTSGLLVFALDAQTAAALGAAFAQRRVRKNYLAVLRGWCPEQLDIDHPLREIDDPGYADRRTEAAASAQTVLRRLALAELPFSVDRYASSRYSLAWLQPLSGRRHQLRRHMKHISHPIIGDAKYGKGLHNRFFQQQLGVSGLLLSCIGLGFAHPVSGHALQLRCRPSPQLCAAADALGWSAQLCALPADESSLL
jgi:tRNA pseudouridine65 synthase